MFIILTQSTALGQLDLELIKQQYQQGKYAEVIEQLAPYQEKNDPLIHEYLASSYEITGQLNFAIFHWEKARELYEQQQNVNKVVKLKLVQAQLEIETGDPQKALHLLQQVPNSVGAVAIKGNAFLVLGEYQKAIAEFEMALKQVFEPHVRLSVLSNLSQAYQKNTLRLKQQQQLLAPNQIKQSRQLAREIIENQELAKTTANTAWKLAQTFPEDNFATIRAWLTWLPYLSKDNQQQATKKVKTALKRLPSTHHTVMLWLKLAKIVDDLQALNEPLTIAQTLRDYQGVAIANGELGYYFETRKDYPSALAHTQEAQRYAQAELAYEELYRWQWQEGRIYQAIGNKTAATLAYEQAVYSLSRTREKLITASKDVQFDFQQEVEPVYREYLSLLLKNPQKLNLDKAIRVFDFLQLTQLENLFQDTCFSDSETLISSPEILRKNKIAVINTIILPDTLHIILTLPEGNNYYIKHEISAKEVNNKIESWKSNLVQIRHNYYLKESKYFYNLLIAPFEEKLSKIEVKQLLFINDGLLRNLPMSALYDQQTQEFLIEKYPISNNLGQKFIKSIPKIESPVIAFGLAESRPPINQSLPNVINELQDIENIWGGQTYLNQEFKKTALIKILEEQRPKILHIATHGIFTGFSETTYLQSYEEIINLNDFDNILQSNPNLSLLTLSACETATGNEKAVLGLAGIAVKQGIPNILGTLWQVQDSVSARLIKRFYQSLEENVTPVKALQLAQLQELKKTNQHPRSWAAFLLVGI